MATTIRRFLAFDIETAKETVGDDWDWCSQRPLGITCAAALSSDANTSQLWHGVNKDGTPARQMSRQETKGLVQYLVAQLAAGYTLVTWNGLGFDLDILAEESGARSECQALASNHVDLMFHVLCVKGFPVALDRAAMALKIPGKPTGMSGMLAPQLWATGRHQEVLEYVAQDVRITLQVAELCEERRRFAWVTRKRAVSSMALPNGWLTVDQALRLPEPDTSWMSSPIPRTRFSNWLERT
jgi:hypothetical protein